MGKLIDLNALTKYDQLIKGSLGKLAGTYATLAALQTAYPTGATGNFLVEADGHWYYWDGAWTDGGEYLSDAVPQSRTIAGIDLADDIGVNEMFNALSIKDWYDTLSDLQTAYPTGNPYIYIIRSNIHWYYWNGSAWTDGGDYFKNIGNFNFVELWNLKKDVSSNFKSINLFDKTRIVSGGYFSSDGSISSNDNSQYLEQYMPIDPNETYKYGRPTSGDNATYGFCQYDINGKFISRITQSSGNTITFDSTARFVRVSKYASAFSATFMFCKEKEYPSEYVDYNLCVIVKEDGIGDGLIQGKNLRDDAVEDKICNSYSNMSIITQDILPLYSILVDNYYVANAGEKIYNTQYQSVMIFAYNNFDIWFDSVSPANTYLSLSLFAQNDWDAEYFIARYRVSDNNMPSSSSKLTVKKGQLIIVTWLHTNTWQFYADGLPKALLLKNFIKSSENPITVEKNGDNYDIFMGNYRFPFYKFEDNERHLNSWDIAEIYLNSTKIEIGNVIGVLKETNINFIGGEAHGNEEYISMDIYCDGLPITGNTSGDKVDIFLISYLKRRGNETQNAFKRIVHITFENSKMTIETTFKCLINNFSLGIAYVGMWGQYISCISKIFNNSSVYDSYVASSYYDDLRTTTIVGTSGIVSITLLNGFENSSFRGIYNYYSSDQRFKNYFAIARDIVMNNGENLYGKTEYLLK